MFSPHLVPVSTRPGSGMSSPRYTWVPRQRIRPPSWSGMLVSMETALVPITGRLAPPWHWIFPHLASLENNSKKLFEMQDFFYKDFKELKKHLILKCIIYMNFMYILFYIYMHCFLHFIIYVFSPAVQTELWPNSGLFRTTHLIFCEMFP